ncbi:MAG: hypothetical protein ABII00_06840 [Elusimicrobiota bacterium]
MTSAVALGIALALPASAAGGAEQQTILELAVAPPTKAFTGKSLVTTWHGKSSRAVEQKVYFSPPGKWRHEVLNASGKVVKTTIQRGTKEWVVQDGYGITLERDVKRIREGDLGRAELKNLIAENFDIEIVGERDLLGFRAKGVSLTPKSKVGPRRVLWVDPKTGIVLHRRQTNHRGRLVRESRMVVLEAADRLPENLFTPPPEDERPIVREKMRPEIESAAALKAKGFPKTAWQPQIPYGYRMDSVRILPVGEARIAHFRYTDGLSPLSLFLSPYAIDASDMPASLSGLDNGQGFAATSWAGTVLGWRQKRLHYLLVGDLSRGNLRKIKRLLRSAKAPG